MTNGERTGERQPVGRVSQRLWPRRLPGVWRPLYEGAVLRVTLALALAAIPLAEVAAAPDPGDPPVPGDSGDSGDPGDPEEASRGHIVLGPGFSGTVEVLDEAGAVVVTMTLRPERRLGVDLPPGTYRVRAADGTVVDTIKLAPGGSEVAELPPGMEGPPPPAVLPSVPVPPPPAPPDTVDPVADPGSRPADPGRSWRRWAAPLLSALIPGVGQMVNKEPGKGVGVLVSSLGLAVGSIALLRARDPFDGAGGHRDDTASDSQEIVTLGAYAGFTGALSLLYVGQILDAARVATGKGVTPRRKYRINLDVTRMTTIGYRAGQPAYALYNDWTVSVLGQAVRRLTVGVADIGFKGINARSRTTFQAGLRVGYRMFDRKRLWLNLAVGSIFQGTTAAGRPIQIDLSEPPPADNSRFGATLYGQVDLRFFVLNRWSLNLIPRFSIPMTTRYYSFDRSLPRFAPTFELGTGAGVYF